MLRGAIFDMDGTLLDSMPVWDHAGEQYLESLGIIPEEDLSRKLATFSMMEGAVYMKEKYDLPFQCEEIIDGVKDIVRECYHEKVPLKPGVREFLSKLKRFDIPMTVATATDLDLAEAALKRTGIDSYFTKVVTCQEAGTGKSQPDIFHLARSYMKTEIEDTWVFEDALHAVKTAKQAGYPVCALYDEANEAELEEIQRLSDIFLNNFAEENFQLVQDKLPVVLTIAGSDSSGGAGIQADLKTMTALQVYGMSCITALTAQNTRGISAVWEVPADFFEQQMESVFSDILPDAVKTGMLASGKQIQLTAGFMKKYHIKNLVVDPVMISTSGTRLLSEEVMEMMKEELFPLAKLLTPNLPEAEFLTGMSICDRTTREEAAKRISERWGCAVLCKGGHDQDNADDLLYDNGKCYWMSAKRIENPNTHGTGCTLSSAIAAYLAKGDSLQEAVRKAKEYMTGAIGAMLDLGEGNGPLNHMWDL
ncbi:MAG: bifunctional hydroxymethylpyrimidine kinase/phosphomethylpyrimidine kinase [Lachnospiraceae bacterium]|nr:bifunctional hydroxymethylpyrimidine kinase/phosphomethylpyrimidine kinase [Lachnospiraceae bacterium]